MTGFIQPRVPPDFGLMTRDRLEIYAAEVDHALRVVRVEAEGFGDDLHFFMRAVLKQARATMGSAAPTQNLTNTLCRIAVALGPKVRSKHSLFAALYFDRTEPGDPEGKTVDVVICKLRPLLRLIDCPIETVWGQGYSMPSRPRLDALVAAFKADGTLPPLIHPDTHRKDTT
ncbi:helix-turn-helix domain-containing protein [Litorimonas sp. WD9-15]|uniref:helix-turn-helix domain-containing protein n=1 Tax=Litorimonas sp. WD9-15 TaxID=3418716 RepID=UPI003D05A281